jgi:hypothetical protein
MPTIGKASGLEGLSYRARLDFPVAEFERTKGCIAKKTARWGTTPPFVGIGRTTATLPLLCFPPQHYVPTPITGHIVPLHFGLFSPYRIMSSLFALSGDIWNAWYF